VEKYNVNNLSDLNRKRGYEVERTTSLTFPKPDFGVSGVKYSSPAAIVLFIYFSSLCYLLLHGTRDPIQSGLVTNNCLKKKLGT
jgi:hypothetical protein